MTMVTRVTSQTPVQMTDEPTGTEQQQEIPAEPDEPTGAEQQQENAIEPDEPTSTEEKQVNASEPRLNDMDLE